MGCGSSSSRYESKTPAKTQQVIKELLLKLDGYISPKNISNDNQLRNPDVTQEVHKCLRGNLDANLPQDSKILRVFTSSTFTGRRRSFGVIIFYILFIFLFMCFRH